MSSKFRAWLRVTPSPSTLAESSAIYKQLKSQGQVQGFARASRSELSSTVPQDRDSTLYHATFTHEPLHLQRSFNVTPYLDVIDPKEADPYNIRGLQNRKPYPAPKTFTCVLEKVKRDGADGTGLESDNPWQGGFHAEKGHWFQTVLEETGVPLGIARGLSVAKDVNVGKHMVEESKGSKKIDMDSLMKRWHKTVSERAKTYDRRSTQSTSVIDVPLQDRRDSNQ